VNVAEAVVRVFISEGDRTNRQKARMKYVLDRIGHEQYLQRVQALLSFPLIALPESECEPRPPIAKHGHVDFHPQKQAGKVYVGILTPVGKLTCAQMRGLAGIADKFGSGTIRLTVWQNVIISDIATENIDAVKAAIEAIGLSWKTNSIRNGLIACTGSAGCKFGASDTKANAIQIAEHVETRIQLDSPINIHLTGCHHSCAQHYIGDIGLIAAKIDENDEQVEGYHVHVGGGYGTEQGIAREVFRDVKAIDAPLLIEKMLRGYMANRADVSESFHAFSNRLTVDELREKCA
jgi:ferredoxin-nitrite reductase